MDTHNKAQHLHKKKVHRVLAHSYAVYFLLFLLGMALDLVFHFKILTDSVIVSLGLMLVICATILIIWAQSTSRNMKKETITTEVFSQGPYLYTRSPTHWGLFFLMVGFGIITGGLFVIICTIIAFFVTKFVFLDKQEKILEEKYGTHYSEYKKLVKF